MIQHEIILKLNDMLEEVMNIRDKPTSVEEIVMLIILLKQKQKEINGYSELELLELTSELCDLVEIKINSLQKEIIIIAGIELQWINMKASENTLESTDMAIKQWNKINTTLQITLTQEQLENFKHTLTYIQTDEKMRNLLPF